MGSTHPSRLVALAILAVHFMPVHAASATPPLQLEFRAVGKVFSTDPRNPGLLPAAPLPPLEACALPITLSDTRTNRRSVGAIFQFGFGELAVPEGATSLIAQNAPQWLEEALATLKKAGYAPGPANPQMPGVNLALRLAHVWREGSALHSHVVLQAEWPGTSAAGATRRYHGLGSTEDLIGRAPAILSTLNMGMTEALHRFAEDLQQECRNTPRNG